MPITLLDGILLVIMLISAILAMVRGFVREVLSIAAWVVAAIAALYLYDNLMPTMERYITNRHLALAASIAAIFLLTLMIVSFLTMRLSDFVLDSSVGILDRTLGFVFGAARGLLLVVVAMLFFNWFMPNPATQPRWIADARSRPLLDLIGARLLSVLPQDPEQSILKQFKDASSAGQDAAPASSSAASPDEGALKGLNQLIQATTTQKP